MTEIVNNPYQPPSQQETSQPPPTSIHGINALKAAIIGPTMLFPVFMFYGAAHGCSGLFGGPTFYGMEGMRRGLFFAAVFTMTIFWPIVLGVLSAAIGFLCSLLIGNKSLWYWGFVATVVGLAEYTLLLVWPFN